MGAGTKIPKSCTKCWSGANLESISRICTTTVSGIDKTSKSQNQLGNSKTHPNSYAQIVLTIIQNISKVSVLEMRYDSHALPNRTRVQAILLQNWSGKFPGRNSLDQMTSSQTTSIISSISPPEFLLSWSDAPRHNFYARLHSRILRT